MRPDYTKIADNDPDLEGDLQTSFNAMLVLTEESTPDEVMVTYRMIGRDIGFAESMEFEDKILASELAPYWLDKSLNAEGVNINDPQSTAVLTSLALSEGLADSIIALGVITSLMFPTLRLGELQTARDKRVRGEA